jgi:shikimate dehydrogenase
MIKLGLIGYPVSHSLSPKIQNAALMACGLEGDYALFPIASEDKQALINLLNRVRANEIQGLNVTIPHKQNVIEYLDELTPTTQAIGAVNTIYLKNKKLVGDNTDAMGFLTDLKKFLSESPAPILGEGLGVREKSAIILGAGGSARAIVYALIKDGWNISLAARRLEQAQEFASSFLDYEIQITNFADLRSATCDLIVNTTPIGMSPNTDQSPLPENLSLPSNTFIYDLVYNPRNTKLVNNARAQGLRATTGLGMLIEQAALSFEIWTGHHPSREILYEAVSNL